MLRVQEQLKRCLARKYQNFLSSDWLPVEDAQYFSVQEFYVPIMLEEKKQTPGGAQRGKQVSNLTDVIQEIMQDRKGNYSLLLEGKITEAWWCRFGDHYGDHLRSDLRSDV